MHRVVTAGLAVCAAATLLLTPATADAATTSGSVSTSRSVEFPSSWYEPSPIRQKPTWLPDSLGENATVILVPGTSDFTPISASDIGGSGSPMGGDQYGRTVGVGFYDAPGGGASYRPKVVVVQYPAAFGIVFGDKEIDLTGEGTYNGSVDIGTAEGVADAEQAWADRGGLGTIILNGYSQSGPVAMNVAYLLHQKYASGDPDAIPDSDIVVVVGADSRFPNTGIETVVPSFVPGAYTNGPRDESGTGDIRVISYCVRGDSVCGLGNPLVHPFATAFYFLPGATIHGQKGNLVNQYEVASAKEVGNTTYVVLDGGNPWGIFLRSLGFAVPPEFDDALDALVPVPEPGEASTIAGVRIPTPRDIQVALADALGLQVPVTDPDALAAQGRTWQAPDAAGESTSEPASNESRPRADATSGAHETFEDYLAGAGAGKDMIGNDESATVPESDSTSPRAHDGSTGGTTRPTTGAPTSTPQTAATQTAATPSTSAAQ
ncbi:hypothetical protein [Gordonia aichiensis]